MMDANFATLDRAGDAANAGAEQRKNHAIELTRTSGTCWRRSLGIDDSIAGGLIMSISICSVLFF